jgi:DNA-binding response OmpR family regulator
MLAPSRSRRPTPLSLVAVGSPDESGEIHKVAQATALQKPRALLVDDSLTLQVTLKDALVAAGFVVVVCKSGEEARRALRHGPYAVVILDVMLPDASGITLAHEVRSFAPTARVPVILLSANASILQRVNGVASGADDYIGKACGTSYVVKRARELALMPAQEQRVDKPGPYRILFIDDSPTFVDALAARMRLAGHDIVVATSGAAALEYLNVQDVDVIVLDLVMPEISGIEMCRRIKGNPALADIPIVVISGREDGAAALTAGSLAGVDDFIRKSQGLPAILSKLDTLLRRRPPGRSKAHAKKLTDGDRRSLSPESRPVESRPVEARPIEARPVEARPAPVEARFAPLEVKSESLPPSLPPRSRKTDPPQSAVRRHGLSDTGETSSVGAGSLLFERVASVCGLSEFIARSSLKRALVRAGIDEATLSGEDLTRALPQIRWALSVFLPPTEIDARMASIQVLARQASEGPYALREAKGI